MRPCPTCQCFVPAATRRCPRCEAALEPIEVRQEVATEREREPVLVGAGFLAAPLTGSGHAEAPATNGAVRALSPAPAPTPPPLPAPCTTDPLVLAVVMGITAPDVTEPEVVENAVPAPVSADTFAAMLGTPPTIATHDELLPSATPKPAPTPTPSPAPAPELVAVPLVKTVGDTTARMPQTRTRFARRDPFARSTTRRERMLTRICMTLAITLAVAVVVLRLPLGARPELSASAISSTNNAANGNGATTVTTSSVFDEAIREQTRTDLQAVVATAVRLYPIWKSYRPETPVVLNQSLPQFGFVAASQSSQRVGDMSVYASAHSFVLAEFAGPDYCAFARVVDRHSAQLITPTRATCRALSAPKTGWVSLGD